MNPIAELIRSHATRMYCELSTWSGWMDCWLVPQAQVTVLLSSPRAAQGIAAAASSVSCAQGRASMRYGWQAALRTKSRTSATSPITEVLETSESG